MIILQKLSRIGSRQFLSKESNIIVHTGDNGFKSHQERNVFLFKKYDNNSLINYHICFHIKIIFVFFHCKQKYNKFHNKSGQHQPVNCTVIFNRLQYGLLLSNNSGISKSSRANSGKTFYRYFTGYWLEA